jgi:hypothetical protein
METIVDASTWPWRVASAVAIDGPLIARPFSGDKRTRKIEDFFQAGE